MDRRKNGEKEDAINRIAEPMIIEMKRRSRKMKHNQHIEGN